MVDREAQRQTRWIKEALWIRKTPMCMNRDAGSYQLSHTWDQVISRSHATSSCKQSWRDQGVRRTSKRCRYVTYFSCVEQKVITLLFVQTEWIYSTWYIGIFVTQCYVLWTTCLLFQWTRCPGKLHKHFNNTLCHYFTLFTALTVLAWARKGVKHAKNTNPTILKGPFWETLRNQEPDFHKCFRSS